MVKREANWKRCPFVFFSIEFPHDKKEITSRGDVERRKKKNRVLNVWEEDLSDTARSQKPTPRTILGHRIRPGIPRFCAAPINVPHWTAHWGLWQYRSSLPVIACNCDWSGRHSSGHYESSFRSSLSHVSICLKSVLPALPTDFFSTTASHVMLCLSHVITTRFITIEPNITSFQVIGQSGDRSSGVGFLFSSTLFFL